MMTEEGVGRRDRSHRYETFDARGGSSSSLWGYRSRTVSDNFHFSRSHSSRSSSVLSDGVIVQAIDETINPRTLACAVQQIIDSASGVFRSRLDAQRPHSRNLLAGFLDISVQPSPGEDWCDQMLRAASLQLLGCRRGSRGSDYRLPKLSAGEGSSLRLALENETPS